MYRNGLGQSLSEYGIIFGLVVVVAISAVFALGSQSNELMEGTHQELFAKQSDGSSRTEKMSGLLSTKKTWA